MLNVLLSFAQFEREGTGERIHDKIAASKKRASGWAASCPRQIGSVLKVQAEFDARDMVWPVSTIGI